ncbi:MAG: glycosyltransferase family 2 protein [Thermoleophilaceae bacterium]
MSIRAIDHPMARPQLTVIVPAADRRPTLTPCLEAIVAADDPPDEVVVADGPAPLGSAQARNEGALKATGDVLVFVDSDVRVRADAFTRIREAFGRDPSLSALFGAYDEAPPSGLVSSFRNLLHTHVHQISAGPSRSFWTGIGAIRREAFLELGGFDVSYPWIRDIDLGMRLCAHGHRTELDPSIQGSHLKQWTLREMLRTDFARRGKPWIFLLLQHRSVPADLNLGWRHRLSASLSLLLGLSLLRRRAAWGSAASLGIVGLNHRLYAMLAARSGRRSLPAAFLLHVIHHLVSALTVPAGVLQYIRAGRPEPPESSFASLSVRSSPAAGQRRLEPPKPLPVPLAQSPHTRDDSGSHQGQGEKSAA